MKHKFFRLLQNCLAFAQPAKGSLKFSCSKLRINSLTIKKNL